MVDQLKILSERLMNYSHNQHRPRLRMTSSVDLETSILRILNDKKITLKKLEFLWTQALKKISNKSNYKNSKDPK